MLSLLIAPNGAPVKPDSALVTEASYQTGLTNTAYGDLELLRANGGIEADSLFWSTKEGSKLLAKIGEIPPKHDGFWSTEDGKTAMQEFAEYPELMTSLRANKKGVLKKKAATKLYTTGLANTAYGDLKELHKYHGLEKDSPFWSTTEGAKLLAKIGEIPEKNDDFWSTEEGAQAMMEFAEMPEMTKMLKGNKQGVLKKKAAAKLVQLESGREIVPDVVASEVRKLKAAGALDMQHLFWTTKDGKKLMQKMGEVPAPGDFFWSTSEAKEAMQLAGEAPELKEALVAHKM